MKYVITGSTGHISKPVAQKLAAAGHTVTVITSNPAKAAEIKALGATPAIGSVEDAAFLKNTFAGADAVYLMTPPNFAAPDLLTYQKKVADNYAAAIKATNVKHAVILSSVGAHMKKGCGPVDGVAYLEDAVAAVDGVNAVFLRPSYFYYNLFQQIGLIKHAGIVTSAQPADYKLILTHTADIAEVAAQKLLSRDFKGHNVQYIASDDNQSWQDIANTLTTSVGKQGVPYVESNDQQAKAGMEQAGLPPTMVEAYVTMGQALRSGEMQADYWKHQNTAYKGKVKLADFAKEFAAAYQAG